MYLWLKTVDNSPVFAYRRKEKRITFKQVLRENQISVLMGTE